MMKRKHMAAMAAAGLVLASLAGCSSGEKAPETKQETTQTEAATTTAEAQSNAEAKPADKKYVVGLAMNTQTNPFFVDVKDGVQKAADELGVELYITDAQDDPTIQMKDIENLITKKPDCIIIDTCDSDAIVSSIEACNEAGIPVLTMDREASGGEVVSHIGYDAIKSGKLAGQYLVDTLGGKGNIVEIQGIMGTNVAQSRSKGFNEVISQNPDMKIVACQVADFDRSKGMSVMENILQANDHIDGLYAANDEMLLGALEAIEAAGRLDEITMIGCDAIDARLGSAQSTSGQGIEMDAIAAVILGGTSLSGGTGFVLPTVVGAMIMGIIDNILTLMNVNPHATNIVKGAVVLIAVLVDKKVKDLSAKAE